MSSVLILDSNKQRRESIVNYLTRYNFATFIAEDIDEVVGILQEKAIEYLLLELHSYSEGNREIISNLHERFPDLEIIVTCDRIHALEAMDMVRHGVDEILLQPLDLGKLVLFLSDGESPDSQETAHLSGQSTPANIISFNDLLFESSVMFDIVSYAKQLANADIKILITGPSGSGKGALVSAIHNSSDRKDKLLVSINCSAIPQYLLESEFFGYEKGAFTDASSQKKGLFELAGSGTLYLDEIGDMSLEMQSKLLKAIDENNFYRIGGRTPVRFEARIISSTNQDLKKKIAFKEFRDDLFYRISSAVIDMPSLSERKADIIPMALRFMLEFSAIHEKHIRNISSEVKQVLMKHPWRGNIRELRNLIECMVINADTDMLLPDDLPSRLVASPRFTPKPVEMVSLKEMERRHIINMLRMYDGNKKQVADVLGIARSTLFEKIRQYEIPEDEYQPEI